MTIAVLKSVGKVPSDSDRLMSVVIGRSKASIQYLSSQVEIQSNEQEALEDANMMRFTSVKVAGANFNRGGGETTGGQCGYMPEVEEKDADSFVILSSKNCKKDVARSDTVEKAGRLGGRERDKSEFRTGHSFFGLLEFLETRDL